MDGEEVKPFLEEENQQIVISKVSKAEDFFAGSIVFDGV